MICITTIIGYFLKYAFNIMLIGRHHKEKLDKLKDIGCGEDFDCIEKIYNDTNLWTNKSELFKKILNDEISQDKEGFYNIIAIYIFTIIL